MTNTTRIQAITANWIADRREIHLEGANADGTTFYQPITEVQASELIADLYEALTFHDEARNRGAAYRLDRGAA